MFEDSHGPERVNRRARANMQAIADGRAESAIRRFAE